MSTVVPTASASAGPPPSPSTRWRLAPGVHVVDRDDDHVQVGLDPPARVIVARDALLVSALRDLGRGRPVRARGPRVDELLSALDAAGLVVTTRPARSVAGTAALLDRGLGLGHLARLLGRSGVVVTTDGAAADVTVVAAHGPVPRRLLDDWVRDGHPHLVLAGAGPAGSLRLGPLVQPGLTACLRCVDAAESSADPRRPLAIEQLAELPTAPLDPAVVTVGSGWAAREVTAFLRGERPVTWSASIDLDEPVPAVRQWRRHPHCGCVWDALPD
ncbi:hypothetical protein ABFT23_08290 [Nocardioides sp. C4-1]|uniref:hypothetical protein n=1 Tax=Nocardioides sp. C4-1 TaxID=3151851 RepID=UPI00326689D8